MRILSVFAPSIAFAMAVPAGAQMNPAAVGLGMVMPAAINAQARRDTARLRHGGRLPTVSPVGAGTRFTPSLVRRKAQASLFLTSVRRMSPEVAQSLVPVFRGDPVRFASPEFAKYGMKANDAADLMAIYAVGAWYGSHGKTNDPAAWEVRAVRDQFRRLYAASPKLRGASNATKQNVGEGCLYLAYVNDVFLSTMKAHPAAKARLMTEIAGGARATFGIDLQAMRITRAGLVSG